jgi:hypothetical protein
MRQRFDIRLTCRGNERASPPKMRCDLCTVLLLVSSASAAALKKGFVTTSGNNFKLDGKSFYFAGSNAYYFPFNDVNIPPVANDIGLTISSLHQMSRRVLQRERRLA